MTYSSLEEKKTIAPNSKDGFIQIYKPDDGVKTSEGTTRDEIMRQIYRYILIVQIIYNETTRMKRVVKHVCDDTNLL